jgi:hypothetical protein
MPKTNIDYSKIILYKIVCNDLNITDLYIGSTTDFTNRKFNHKSSCNNKNNKKYHTKKYQIIRDNGGWSNWSMIEIEKYPCLDGNEARMRERYYYELLKANMNSANPITTDKENKEKKKTYQEINKDKIKAQRKIRDESIKDELSKKYKKFYIDNKEYNINRAKEYYNVNKDAINLRRRELRKEKKALKENEI